MSIQRLKGLTTALDNDLESSEQLCQLFNGLPLRIAYISITGRILKCNDRFAKWLTATTSSLVEGRFIGDFLDQEETSGALARLSSVVNKKNLQMTEEAVISGSKVLLTPMFAGIHCVSWVSLDPTVETLCSELQHKAQGHQGDSAQ